MKAVFLILCMISSVLILPVQAQTTSEFGHQLHPKKLLENTEGTLQIFVLFNEMMVPKQIENLKVVSSDNEIIQILDIGESNDKFIKNVLVLAKKPGIATIVLAAPGLASKEISLQVFNNNNYPSQILMKVTPEKFPIDGPKYGYIALELATTGGLPTMATEDIVIHLDTPNKNIIKLKNSEIIVSAGEYYVITEFEIIGSGDAIIFAETEGMKKISRIVEILEASTPLQLQLYVFPENFNSFSGTAGYAIVQLLDADGDPVIAEKNINFKLGVENPNISVNSSHDFEEISFGQKQLVIEKGHYSAFTKFTPIPNIGDYTESAQQTYNIFISAEDVLTRGDSITVHHDQVGALEGNGPSITKVLPFLTTGKEEIIAVTYYETDIEVSRQSGGSTQGTTNRDTVTVTVPVQAKNDHKITFSSSELDTVNPIDPTMKKGENIVIVFGETGTVAPEESVIFYITDNDGVKTVTGMPVGPIEEDISLMVEPLIPIILAEREFPLIVFLEEGSGDEETAITTDDDEDEDARLGVTQFIEDGILTFSANDYVETNSITIKQNQPYVIVNMMSNKVGDTTLSYQMSGFEGTTSITSHTTDPALIDLAFQKNILTNSKTLATVQLLDSLGNPVYVKKDINIILVSNNENVLKTEQELIIKDRDYFTTIEFETFGEEGQIELALLSENFDLSKFIINVIDVAPVLSLDLLGQMNYGGKIKSELSVTVPEISVLLEGFDVEWDVTGGEVIRFDNVTDSEGLASLDVIANEKNKVVVSATISGNGLSSASISKTAQILNMPIIEPVIEEKGLEVDPLLLLLIIIPSVIAGSIFYLKRVDKLGIITERIPDIGERISEVKDKISDIRDR